MQGRVGSVAVPPVPPAYRRVMQDIVAKVDSGVLAGGQALRPPRELAAEYAELWGIPVSEATVRKATDLLQELGVLVGHQGQAVYVRATPGEG